MNWVHRSSFLLVGLGLGAGPAWAAKPKKLEIVRAFASSSADKQPPESAIDGKREKHNLWGANGDGATLTLDLGKVCTVYAVAMAAPHLDNRPPRVHAFEIQVSADDRTYRTVLVGESRQPPLELDRVDIPPSAARYVRYFGHANTFNSWTVLAEIEAWGLCDGGVSAPAPPTDETFEPPRLLENAPPIEHAARAKDLGWSGLLVFCATVDQIGRVSSTRIIQAPAGPYAGWKDVVAASVSQWKFEPARRGGKPVKAFYEGTVVMSQNADEEKAIAELFARFGAAWDARDAASLVALLHPMKRRLYAAAELPPDPEAATAWLTKHLAGSDVRPLRDLRVDAVDLQPFGDAGSLAGQFAYCELSFERPGPTRFEAGTFSATLLKSTDGAWRIFNLAVPPAPPLADDEDRPVRAPSAQNGRKGRSPAALVQAVFRDGRAIDTEVLIDNPEVADVPKHVQSTTLEMDAGERPRLMLMVVREREPETEPKTRGNIKDPKVTKYVKPEYPPTARAARIQGIVIVQFTVTSTGDVTDVRVVKGHAALKEAAVKAVSQWKYTPTVLNGVPVPVIMTVTTRFALD